jgi:hypothetical protein
MSKKLNSFFSDPPTSSKLGLLDIVIEELIAYKFILKKGASIVKFY